MSIETIARNTGVSDIQRLPRDASPREYFRGNLDGRSVIVMQYPEMNEKNRHEMLAFSRIGGWIGRIGLCAPEVLNEDTRDGYALLEDFGQVSFGRSLREGGDRNALYALGCDVLKTLGEASTIVKGLPLYWDSKIHENRRQILDYYAPVYLKKSNNNNILQSYLDVLSQIETSLPPCPQGFIHGDFHLENLMFRSEGEGLSRCGIIDFQDALFGPLPYDLVNLLEDARVDVPSDLRAAMIDRYCAGMTPDRKDAFECWYRFLGTQFHCRVIGLFIKFAAEQGRDQYLVHIPRLQRYILDGVEHPVMQPLKRFFIKEKIDFLPNEHMNGDYVRSVFRDLADR